MRPEPAPASDVSTLETRAPGRPPSTGWEKRYLKAVRQYGTKVRSATRAGVSYRTVERRVNRDRVFAEAVERSMQWHADKCEEGLVATSAKGNPVGLIVRLKALRPELYIEKHAVLNVNAHLSLDGADALTVLRQMLAHATPATHQAIIETTATRHDAELPPAPDDGA